MLPENPNFKLAIREDFDENCDGVYWANILRAFDTNEQAEAYVDVRRNVLPLNYFDRPAEQDNLDKTIGSAFDIDFEQVVKCEPVRIDSLANTLAQSDDSVIFMHVHLLVQSIVN